MKQLNLYSVRLKNWLWSAVLGALLLGGVAGLWSLRQTPIYEASAEFVLEIAEGKPVDRNEEVQNYVEWMVSEPVLSEVLKESSNLVDSAESFKANMRSSADANNHLYWHYQDTDPIIAATLVNRISEIFARLNDLRQSAPFLAAQQGIATIKDSQQLIIDDSQTAIGIATNEIERLKKALAATGLTQKKTAELQQELTEQNGKLISLKASLNTAQASYNKADLSEKELLAEIARKSNRLILVNSATPPTVPIAPNLGRNIAIGALVGTLVGLGVGVWRFRSSVEESLTTDKSSQSAESGNWPVWVNLPNTDLKPASLLLNPQAEASFASYYHLIEKKLEQTFHDQSRYLLTIASSENDGQSDLFAANLGIALAKSGRNVILVDANVERPILHQLFALSNQRGLTTAVLDSKLQIDRHLQESSVKGLQLVARGPMATASADFVTHPRLQQLLSTLAETHDCFILNLGYLYQLETLSPILSHAPHCLLTIPASSSTPQLSSLEVRLKKAGLQLVGLILQTSEKENVNGKKQFLSTPIR